MKYHNHSWPPREGWKPTDVKEVIAHVPDTRGTTPTNSGQATGASRSEAGERLASSSTGNFTMCSAGIGEAATINLPADPAPEGAAAPRLQEIRERCDKATAGPWESDGEVIGWLSGDAPAVAVRYDRGSGSHCPVCMCAPHLSGRYGVAGGDNPIEDAEFIAHARTDIPYLLDLAQALTLRVQELERYGKTEYNLEQALRAELEAAECRIAALTGALEAAREACGSQAGGGSVGEGAAE
jgi:hypothetical protein